MPNPTSGGWEPEQDPYEPARPETPPSPGPVGQYPNPQYPNPASPRYPSPQRPPYPNPANPQQPPYPNPPYPNPPYAGQFGGGSPPPGSRTNRIVIAVTAVVVLALVTVAVVAVMHHKKTVADPSTSAIPSSVVSTTPSASATSSPSTPTTSPTSGISNKDQLCTDPMAQTDLIHLTVSLEFTTSYRGADAYEKGIIDDCATPAVIKELTPYFGKDLGLPGGDLTGGNNSGATARYSVQLVNTSKYVSFTLNRRSTGGYQVVAASGS